jgi:hypothetical protein
LGKPNQVQCLRDTGRVMSEESTTSDPVALTRTGYEPMDRELDFDALADLFARDAVWDLSESHLGIYEGAAAIGEFLVATGRRARTIITRSKRFSIAAMACCLSSSGKTAA